jgi:hypothetical protein
MIGAGCFEKLLKVICGLSRLPFEITLGCGDELRVRVVSVFIIIIFVTAGGNRDSLGPLLRPPSRCFAQK